MKAPGLPVPGWILLAGYRLLSLALTPFWLALLLSRLAAGKEDPRRLHERLGWPSCRRPPGRLIWFHAASVGELNSLLPIFRELRALLQSGAGCLEASRPSMPVVLVTTVTRSSATLAKRVLPEGVIHQYVPIDHWLALLPFRLYWRPRVGVLAEAELWPELVVAMPRLHLINARMSERSFLHHRRWRCYGAWLLSRVEVCLAQSQADAGRFRRLGARRVRALGSTKLDADPPPVNPASLSRLNQVFAGRRVLLLASSHPGEEQQWLDAWVAAELAFQPLGLLLAPRHPHRAREVLGLAAARGLRAVLWSDWCAETCLPAPDVLVADVIGEMGSFISAAAVVVMGGSFQPLGKAHGGQNPLEPVALGRPVFCGPDMANFSDLIEPLLRVGCLEQHVDVSSTLAAALPWLQAAPSQGPVAPPRLQGPAAALASMLLSCCR